MNTEVKIAKTNELADGQMKEVRVQDRCILLLRFDGEYKAYTPECPHKGAPLAEGFLHKGRLRCPWHQAVFDAASGDLLEPPALDQLPHYDVHIDGEDVIVSLPKEPVAESRPPAMVGHDPDQDDRTFAILGAGAAGLAAAETLRQEGFHGRIIVLTRERDISYDRTALSKSYLADEDAQSPAIRTDDFYGGYGIEVLTEHEVAEADCGAKTLQCRNGISLDFDKLLIATGGLPRSLAVPGEDLANVFGLRSLADCERLRSSAEDATRAVVVGASFIGMEVAASLRSRGLAVTVVAPDSVPFGDTLGEEIGLMYRKVHEEEGTKFRLESGIDHFEGVDGAVQYAVLNGGDKLAADLVVVGIGVSPATGFLKGVPVNNDGSVPVDARCRVKEDIHAAGDIARFPDWRSNAPIRIEHWRLAQQLGRAAARGMLGQDVAYRGVPFFWTSQHGVITQYLGYTRGWNDLVFDGSPADRDFLAYYTIDRHVHAVAGCGRSMEMNAIAEILRDSHHPTVEEIRQAVEDSRCPQST